MDKVINERLEQLVKRVDTLQATVDRFIDQLNDDRKDLSDMKVNIAKLEASVSGAREDIHDQTKVMVKEVRENLSPMPDIVGDAVSEAVKKKKGLFRK